LSVRGTRKRRAAIAREAARVIQAASRYKQARTWQARLAKRLTLRLPCGSTSAKRREILGKCHAQTKIARPTKAH